MLVALVAASACADSPASEGAVERASGATVRDSAGVHIVQMASGALEGLPEWRLADEPTVTIGVVDGEAPYVFGRIGGAFRFPDGGFAVFDAQVLEVRTYDSDGEFVSAFGRRGDGPGEFGGVRSVDRIRGDSVAVWDHFNQRVTVFSREGEVGREYSTRECESPDDGSGRMCVIAMGFLPDGSFVLQDRQIRGDTPPVDGPTEVTMIRIGRVAEGSYEVLDSLRQLDYFLGRIDGRTFGGRKRFGAFPVWALEGPRFALGRGDSQDIRIHDMEAGVLRILRLGDPPRPVTQEDLAPYDEVDWEDDEEAAMRAWLRDFEPASTVPLFGEGMHLDTEGNVWISEYIPYRLGLEDDDLRWTVIGLDGEPLGTIELPSDTGDLWLTEVGPDEVLTVETDSLGVQRVASYAILKGGG